MKAVWNETHTHKTFLIEVVLATVRVMGKIGLAVVSSGFAAELLGG